MESVLNLNKKEFQNYLDNISKISDNAILDISKNEISTIVSSDDRSLYLWSTLKGDFDLETTLNLPSLRKLSKALNMIGSDRLKLTINSNNLEYKGDIKFRYHLYDEGIITKPKLTLAKIKSFEYQTEFPLNKSFFKNLLKTSSIFKDTKKLYVYTNDDQLWWSLADRTMANTDTFSINSGEVDFELDDFILNLDNMALISFGEQNDITVKINSMGLGNFHISTNNLELNYIVSSLTK